MRKSAAAVLNSRLALKFNSSRKRRKEETLTAYCEVVNQLLETCATEGRITETDAKTMRFTQQLNKIPLDQAKFSGPRFYTAIQFIMSGY